MSSTLQNNIENLQNILNSINNLPDGNDLQLPTLSNEGVAADLALGKQLIDSNGAIITGTHECVSTGVNVQRATGTVRISNGSATVNCGFQPDLVAITDTSFSITHNYVTYEYMLCFLFPEKVTSRPSSAASYYNNGSDLIVSGISVNSSGFSLSGMVTIASDYSNTTVNNKTFNYVAIKYTE